MRQLRNQYVLWLFSLALALGCTSGPEMQFDDDGDYYQSIATKIEEPVVCEQPRHDLQSTPAPISVRNSGAIENWPMTLQEAIQIALARSEVIRDNGGRIVSTPQAASTVYDIALQESSTRSGPEAALSAFDAQWKSSMAWQRNELFFNNILIGGGSNRLNQDTANFAAEVSKINATGGKLAVRNLTNYNFNRAFFNTFSATYDTQFEIEAVQPFMQGSGIEFNRIAGPLAQPGVYNGIVLARLNTDVTLADFEIAVRDLLRDIELTYWDLYFAYRDLDAKMVGRESALETWRLVQRKLQAGAADEEMEARAREQYYLFESQVVDALGGTSISGTIVSTTGGVYSNERKLRGLLGLPASDGRLIRPADEPQTVDTVFNWEESLQDSLVRRAELRRQRWVVRRRELELVASNNFLQSRVDGIARYSWNGLGSDLFGSGGTPQGSAYGDLINRNRANWTLGAQWSTPIGNRIGHTAVRNAEWALARERTILREQELQVTHELSRSFSDLDRSYVSTRANFNRALAAREQLEQIRKKYDAGAIPLDALLDAQRRATQADSAYYRALVDYNTAIASVCRSRGTLLSYYQIHLAEGPWTPDAYRSAIKQSRQFKVEEIDYTCQYPCPVSHGSYPQIQTQGEMVPLPSTDQPIEQYEVLPSQPQPDAASSRKPSRALVTGPVETQPDSALQKVPDTTSVIFKNQQPLYPTESRPMPPTSVNQPGGPAVNAAPPKPQTLLNVPEFE